MVIRVIIPTILFKWDSPNQGKLEFWSQQIHLNTFYLSNFFVICKQKKMVTKCPSYGGLLL